MSLSAQETRFLTTISAYSIKPKFRASEAGLTPNSRGWMPGSEPLMTTALTDLVEKYTEPDQPVA
jgi:hypothetical protein